MYPTNAYPDIIERCDLPHGRDSEICSDRSAVFMLAADIVNPKPDRRSKDWNNLPIWPAGTRIRVVVRRWNNHPDNDEHERNKAFIIGAWRPLKRFAHLEWSDMNEAQAKALLDGLMRQTRAETVAESLERAGLDDNASSARNVLTFAVEKGLLGLKHAMQIADVFTNDSGEE